MRILILVVTLLWFSTSCAADLHFELYSLKDGEQELIASGVKHYSKADFIVFSEERGGRFYGTRKILELHDGFAISILETYDSAGGFGLSVEHLPLGSNPNSFSWEWYDPTNGSEYLKRQGATRVKVLFSGLPVATEVASVHFIEDTVFRYIVDIKGKDSVGRWTHILRILSGSVLEFPR